MYTIKSNTYIISSSILSPYLPVVRDLPDTVEQSKKELAGYISDVITILKSKLDQFGEMHIPTSHEKEERLRRILEGLISAKRLWHEEFGKGNSQNSTCLSNKMNCDLK